MDFVKFSEFNGGLSTHYHVNEFKLPQLSTIKERSKGRPQRPPLHQHSWYPGPPSHRVGRRRVWEEELWDREGLWETFGRRGDGGGEWEANMSAWQWCHTCGEVDRVVNLEEGEVNKEKKEEKKNKEIDSEGEEWMAALRLKVEGEEEGKEVEEETVESHELVTRKKRRRGGRGSRLERMLVY